MWRWKKTKRQLVNQGDDPCGKDEFTSEGCRLFRSHLSESQCSNTCHDQWSGACVLASVFSAVSTQCYLNVLIYSVNLLYISV